MPSAQFTQVYKTVGTFKDNPDKTGDPTNDEQLDLYAWAKVTNRVDIKTAPKPGMLDIKGKAMRKRWQKWVDDGISAQNAEKKYIELGQSLINKYLK